MIITDRKKELETGSHQLFFLDGQIHKDYQYKGNVLHGECKLFHSNGEIEYSCFYENGIISGWTKVY